MIAAPNAGKEPDVQSHRHRSQCGCSSGIEEPTGPKACFHSLAAAIDQNILLELQASCQFCSLLLRLHSLRWRRAPALQRDNQQWELGIPFMTFAVIRISETKLFWLWFALHSFACLKYRIVWRMMWLLFCVQKDSASFLNPLDLEQVDQLLQDIETASTVESVKICILNTEFPKGPKTSFVSVCNRVISVLAPNRAARACSKSCQTASWRPSNHRM